MLLPAALSNSWSFLTAGPRSSRCSTESRRRRRVRGMAIVGGSEKSGVVIDLSGTVVFSGKGPPVLVLQSIDQAVLSAKADECPEMRRFAVAHRVDQCFGIGETGRSV